MGDISQTAGGGFGYMSRGRRSETASPRVPGEQEWSPSTVGHAFPHRCLPAIALIAFGLGGVSWAAPPVIHSLSADPSQVYPAAESQLSCDASDPDGDVLSFSWTSDLGVVTAGEDGAAIFTSTDTGFATVTCTVTDPNGEFATAEVGIVVASVIAERSLREGLRAPQKVSVDSMGDLYTADRAAGGINVIHLFTETLVYRLPIADVRSVAVDWQDDLLVGGGNGARIIDRAGSLLLTLDPLEPLRSAPSRNRQSRVV